MVWFNWAITLFWLIVIVVCFTLLAINSNSLLTLSKKDIFSKYKKNHTVFFETGTHKGESIDVALELNFSKIISVEIDQDYYLNCFDIQKAKRIN